MALLIAGCSIPLPVTIGHYLVDIGLTVHTGKSSTEHVISEITGEDCNYSYFLSTQKICLSEEEYMQLLIDLNCKEYAWDIKNQPYCREGKKLGPTPWTESID